MTNQPRKIIVTGAMLYANGPLHLGHLVEYIQADIWVRFQKMRGHTCYYICGNDGHGTPIMLSAEKKGLSPEALITAYGEEHRRDFSDFFINFDNFYTSHSSENRQLVDLFYQRLKEHSDLEVRNIEQAYDSVEKMFLPDRYVRGTCPRCGTKNQYGDNCEACGATYTPTDLINPVSVLSGTTPIIKSSEHVFFKLSKYQDMLCQWFKKTKFQPEITHKLQEWFEEGLQDWDISRDAPYFGFEIPDLPNKYFYVWLDAPISYIASFENFCEKNLNIDCDEFWKKNSTELYHFIGKDIVYFHALFWPAMLTGAQYRKPTNIFVHGFLTIDGQKMSKSRGTFIKAHDYLAYLAPEYLRYYYAAKLSKHVEDIDLNFNDFLLRVNSDLVGKVINIASRCAKFINQHFDNQLAEKLEDETLFDKFIQIGELITNYYETREFSRAIREIMRLADLANQYIDEQKPWILIKESDANNKIKVQLICTQGLNLYRQIIVFLKPILPDLTLKTESFLNITPLLWDDYKQPLLGHVINKFKPLMTRIRQEQIDNLLVHVQKNKME